jgi:hypothetical protein
MKISSIVSSLLSGDSATNDGMNRAGRLITRGRNEKSIRNLFGKYQRKKPLEVIRVSGWEMKMDIEETGHENLASCTGWCPVSGFCSHADEHWDHIKAGSLSTS